MLRFLLCGAYLISVFKGSNYISKNGNHGKYKPYPSINSLRSEFIWSTFINENDFSLFLTGAFTLYLASTSKNCCYRPSDIHCLSFSVSQLWINTSTNALKCFSRDNSRRAKDIMS